jgi:hypothetical protein
MLNSALGEDLLRASEALLMTDCLVSVSELKTSQRVGKRKFSGSRRCEASEEARRHIPCGAFSPSSHSVGRI